MSENTENTLTSYLGPEFQQRLMWQLLVEPEFAEKTISNLAIEYFDDPNLKRLFIIILEYFKENGKVPNLQNQSILQAINKYKTPNNIIEEESLFAVIKRIELWNERIINKQLLYDGDIIQKQTREFIKQQEYRKVGEYILTKTKNGEIRSKFFNSDIQDKIQKISHIGDEEDYGTDVFDNIDHALRKEFRQTIATGVGAIDILTGGGLGKQEIGVILTPSGVGKTTLLTVIANTAYEDQKNVAQIVFEDTIEQIQRKHFTIWSKVPLSKIDEEEQNVIVNRIAHEKAVKMKGKGNLVIKKFSQENTTMMDIRNWMIGYEKKYGIKFDILVLDYLDCLESHKKSPDRNEAELVIIKSFEALASDFDIPAWTAIQTNRSGFNAEYVEAYQTGGSIKRIQKAHFFMSVAKTRDQAEASLANIRIIKARFAKDGQAFNDCVFNNDTLEIRIEDPKYPLQAKGVKHHDTEDINKLDKTIIEIQEKSSELRLQTALSKREESLLSQITNPDINDNIKLNDEPVDLEQFIPKTDGQKIENMHIETTRTDLSETEIKQIYDIAKEAITETKKTEGLIEIEGNVEIKTENDGVSEGVNDGVSEGVTEELKQPWGTIVTTFGKPVFEWTGDTNTVNVTEKEVKFEDVSPPKETNVQGIVQKYDEINKNNPSYSPPKAILNKEQVEEIERELKNPDAPPVEHMGLHEKLKLIEKHQDIFNKK
jgi:replicative DNA helicase